jgi:hypothetical protein
MSNLAEAGSRVAEIERRLRAMECGLLHLANNQALDGDQKTLSGFVYELMSIQDQIEEAKAALDDHRTDLDENWKRLKEREKQNEQDAA